VNVALINRYFGSKFKLFEAAIATRSPAPDLSATELRQLPRQLADYAVQPRPSRPSMRALVGAAGSTEAQELLRNLLETALIQQIATRLPGPDALQRARMATAILIGAATARSVFGPADLPDDELTERLTAVLRTCLID
jgi:AcrR family transcriptional regulator